MVWFDLLLAVVFGLLSIGPFASAEHSADEGNFAGVIWHGLWFFLMATLTWMYAFDVAQYMGWI